MPDIEKTVVPFYKDDLLTAKEKDQLAEWRASFRESGNCAKALDKAMNDNWADNRMDTKKVLDTVVAEFGFERTAHVLAAQVFNHDWDGRYDRKVKDWAKSEMAGFSQDFIEESRDYYLNAHPILIDGVAKTAMAEQVKEISQDKSDHDIKPPEPPKEPEKPQFKSPKEKVAEITDKLEKGIKELFEGEKFKEYLDTMSKFHNYSFNNTLLIAMQKPDATLVAGFNAWKNDFGRNVNKGEKGIQIFAPAPYKIKKEEIKRDPDTDLPVLDKDGKPIVEEVERVIPNFKVVSVFDVSQTNGKEIPSLGVDELSGNVTDYEKLFEALKEISPVPIKFAEIDGSAKGFFHQEDKSITIKEGMSEAQTVKTAIHEIAHAMLHDKDLKKSDLEKSKDRATEEVEAESIAYTVCQHFGVDTSDYSFAYVASWGTGKDTPELKASLETIRSTASELITQISDKYLGLDKDKTQEKTAESPEQPKKSNIIGNVEYSSIEDKQYFRLNSDTAQKVAEKLTEQNVPFSGRINGDKTTLTIGKADVESYKAIMAEIKGQAKEASKQEKAVEAPEKPKKSNIIGNVEYKSIENKQYFKLDTDTAQKVAEKLAEQNIPFSGRVTGENTTLTIGKTNVESYKAVIAEVTGNVKETPTVEQPKAEPTPKKDKGTIIGNTDYKDIPNKSYAKLSTEKALAVAEILDRQGVQFSGRTVGDKTTLTISKDDMSDYKEALAAVNKSMQKETAKTTEQTSIPDTVYTQSFDYANEHGENKAFHDSHKANMACLWDMKATAEIYAVSGRMDKFVEDLSEKYGTERPLFVLARTVQAVEDNRFSPETKQIASQFDFKDIGSVHSFSHQYVTDIKPSVIDEMMIKLNAMEHQLEKAPEMQEYTGKMPDEKITIAERNAYGYDSNELLPLTAEKALEFFDNDTVAVYLLYPDGTEGQANERSDIENHNGIFGVETVEWERYQAFEKRMDDLAAQEPSREALLLNGKECAAGIYQLNNNPENRDIRFMDSSYLESKGIEPDRENYTLVYSFPVVPEDLQNKSAFLEQVFDKFNTDHPKDFAGHSLSVSDVVVIQQNGELSAHYVDRAGFTELANFGAVRENPLKAVEDTIEQNDNSFDGVINNVPSMDELEARAKRGEQVSVSEMFDAAKAEQTKAKQPVKKTEEKRSIRQYLKQSQDKKPEQPKEKAQEKSKGVEL